MLEKDLENLIARYPDDFFPDEGFHLIAQQYVIDGRRIDIVFEDKADRRIIIEVKRGILSREASGQIAEYYGLLKSKDNHKYYELIVAANVIPKERKLFLEHIGIECKELGIALVSDVAQRHGYIFLDDASEPRAISLGIMEMPDNKYPGTNGDISVWIFQANPRRYDLVAALSDQKIGKVLNWMVNQHVNEIKRGHLGIIWISGKEAGIYAVARVETNPTIKQEFPEERQFWITTSEPLVARRVELSILKSFVNKPILRQTLKEIEGLQNLSILRQAQGTNFPVSNKEWRLISKLI